MTRLPFAGRESGGARIQKAPCNPRGFLYLPNLNSCTSYIKPRGILSSTHLHNATLLPFPSHGTTECITTDLD